MIEFLPTDDDVDLRPRIKVVGIGGAGGNAINNMIRANLDGVEFMAINTDAQALRGSQADHKLQLGREMTKGLGAGSKPDIGREAARETLDEVGHYLADTHMVFITAGMGGGTGTGAAPVIAEAAREAGVLTVGVVTKPFHFEGAHRMRVAEAGIEELQKHVDTLIVIPNQNLFRIATEKTTFADAFRLADDVLRSGVRGVSDLMISPGMINLDFADIRSVMAEMGKAMMGTGEASGERRALDAAEAAISNPLLDDVSMRGARGVLINITGGQDITLFELDEAANRIREEVDPEANIIFGSTLDEQMEGAVRVSVVATGIDGGRVSHSPEAGESRTVAQGQQPSATIHAGPGTGAQRAGETQPAAASQPAAATHQPQPQPQGPASEPSAPAAEAAAEEPPLAATGSEDASPARAAGPAGDSPAERDRAGTSGLDLGDGPAPAGLDQSHPDVFIAPQPKRPGDFTTQTRESQPASGRAPTGQEGGDLGESRRRGPTLFQKVTGMSRKADDGEAAGSAGSAQASAAPLQTGAAQPQAGTAPQPGQGQAAASPDKAPATARGDSAAQPAEPGEQPELGGLAENPSRRASTATQQDNLLDIPAFLRRQAN